MTAESVKLKPSHGSHFSGLTKFWDLSSIFSFFLVFFNVFFSKLKTSSILSNNTLHLNITRKIINIINNICLKFPDFSSIVVFLPDFSSLFNMS